MTSQSRPPLPTTVSEQAQQFLLLEIPRHKEIALDDTTAWLQHANQTDANMLAAFPSSQVPVHSDEIEVAGVRVYVLRPHGVEDDRATPVYLDIHGGGLFAGGGEACRLMGQVGAMSTGLIHWSVDYRMPPLHPYPAALDDCLTAYQGLLERRDPQDIFVGGRSAGGNLAAALMLRIKQAGLAMPRGLILLSPELDLTESGDTFTVLDGIDNVLSPLLNINKLYAGGHDLADPYLSPLFGDLADFPPTLLQSGTRDMFLSNTVRMHRRLLAAGVDAELHVWEAMPHAGFGGATPEDLELAAQVRQFLRSHSRD